MVFKVAWTPHTECCLVSNKIIIPVLHTFCIKKNYFRHLQVTWLSRLCVTVGWALLSKAPLWMSRFISEWNVRMSSPYWMHWNRRKTFLWSPVLHKQSSTHGSTTACTSSTCGAAQQVLVRGWTWLRALHPAAGSMCCCTRWCGWEIILLSTALWKPCVWIKCSPCLYVVSEIGWNKEFNYPCQRAD